MKRLYKRANSKAVKDNILRRIKFVYILTGKEVPNIIVNKSERRLNINDIIVKIENVYKERLKAEE